MFMQSYDYCKAESEVVTSYLMKGIKFPDAFISLRKVVACFCDVQVPELKEEINKIRESFYRSDSLMLKMAKVLDLYRGGESAILQDIYRLAPQIQEYVFALEFEIESRVLLATKQMQTTVETMQTIADFANQVDRLQQEKVLIDIAKDKLTSLRQVLQYIEILPSLVGHQDKITLKPLYTKYDEKFLKYLIELEQSFDLYLDVPTNVVIFTALGAIHQVIPQDFIHPFKQDECDNLVKLLMFPEDYMETVRAEGIVSPKVASLFCRTYPTLALQYLDTNLEELSKMDYQKQLNFKECFDLHENLGDLSSQLTRR